MVKFLLVYIAILLLITNGQSLFNNIHFQTKYCNSDFVIRATVQRVINNEVAISAGYISVEIIIKTQFKISQKFLKLPEQRTHEIWIANNSPEKLNITFGQKYLISGIIRNIFGSNKLIVNRVSSLFESWQKLNHRQKSLFNRNQLDQNCNCQIYQEIAPINFNQKVGCGLYKLISIPRRSRRRYNQKTTLKSFWNPQLEQCYYQFSYCGVKAQQQSSCQWVTGEQFWKCAIRSSKYGHKIPPAKMHSQSENQIDQRNKKSKMTSSLHPKFNAPLKGRNRPRADSWQLHTNTDQRYSIRFKPTFNRY